MSDGRGGVSALVRAAVASADASSLKVLDLSFNALVSLDDDDGTPVASGGVFASLPALEDLRVGDNKLTTLQSRNLERVGDRLRSLRAQNNALESLTGVEKLRALETLRVDGNPSLSASPRVTFASLPSSLTSLNLSRCALTSLDGFRDAAAARRLEELRLDGNFFASPSVFEPLKNCQRLVELHVADARLTPASLAGLRALAPTLETLVLDGNPGLAPESDAFEPANQNKVATENARRFRLDAETKKNVSKEKEPERFTFVLALHRAPRLPALTSLSVSRCGARSLGPSGWSLADVAPKLERLDASRNALADAAALETGSELKRLKEVVLAGNPMCFCREVATFHSPETNENENGLSGEEDAERETASSDATKKSLETYLQTVTHALPRVAFVDHVAVKKAARGKPSREKKKQHGTVADGAEKSAAKSSDVVSVDGSGDDDSQDDLSYDLSEELSDEELSGVSGLSDLEADAEISAVRVRDGAVRRGSDAGADADWTESGADLERNEGKKAVSSPSEVVKAFRSAMIAHDREMRASLARVRAALAATPTEAAAALRLDGTFLAAGRDVPSRTLPPAPTLQTLAPQTRVGDSFSKRAGSAPVVRGKDTKEIKGFPMSVSEETRRIDRVSAPAGDATGKKNAKADPAPICAASGSARVSSAAQSVAALKARRRAASAAGGFGGFRVPSATQKTA